MYESLIKFNSEGVIKYLIRWERLVGGNTEVDYF